MKHSLTSATAALKAVRCRACGCAAARWLFVIGLGLCVQGYLFAGSHQPQSPGKITRNASRLRPELRVALRALDSATSGSPAAIADASRAVIALALRDFAALQIAQGLTSQAVENYRRSIDFGDVPAAHVDLAFAYLSDAHPDQALSQVTDVLLREPGNARAWRVLGQVWMIKRNYGQAAESLRKSNALQPASETSRLLQIALLRLKNPKSTQGEVAATTVLHHTSKLSPVELEARQRSLPEILARALNDLGTAEARQQQFSLALAHFHEAEQWQPGTPGLMRNIGMAATRVADYAEAARALRAVVAADPNDALARSMLGTALFSIGSYDEATRAFAPLGDAALEQPGLAYAWAESLVKLNRYNQAAAMLDKMEGRPLTASTLVLVAQTWAEMGNYPRTVAACHKALQQDPALAQAHYIAGLALIHQDRPADAAAEFRAELQHDPANTDAEYHLAFVLFQLSQDQEAMHLLRDVLVRDPNHPDANYELGKALLNAGKTAEAIPYLEAAARLKPGLDAVHYQLQAAYRSVGRKADADREANIYRAMKAKSRNITLPPPRSPQNALPQSQ